MRNKDNFKNSFDYLINQIFKYDFNNKEHVHILKMKFWCLDSIIRESEKILDIDIKNPKNHEASLKNELVFLDRYIRTKDKKLEKYEQNFFELVSSRKQLLQNFISQKNPITNEYNKDYEMSYEQRPTLINNQQFEELYKNFKIKQNNNELNNALEIISKITSENIDNKCYSLELNIKNNLPIDQQEENLRKQGINEKKKEDDDFVLEMNRAHEEILEILQNSLPILPTPPLPPEESENPDEQKEIEIWEDLQIIGVNFPTFRELVSEIKDDISHKGMIIETSQLRQGGYRFTLKKQNLKDIFIFPDKIENKENSVIPYKVFDLEWNFNDFLFAFYYIKIIKQNNEDEGKKTYILKPAETNIINKNRYNELNKRWENFNQLRENQIQNIGTRSTLETMFDTDIIDISSDLKHQYEIRVNEKGNIIEILKENCLFGEFE